MKTKSLQFTKLTESAVAILRKVASPKSAAPQLVSFLCGWFDCPCGTYWHVDAEEMLLTPAFCWHTKSFRADKPRRDTDARSLPRSEGTAAHVRRTGIPICTFNIVRDICLLCPLDAREAGLLGGIWFPIRSEQTTYAVLELLGQNGWAGSEQFIGKLTKLGFALGKVCTNNPRES